MTIEVFDLIWLFILTFFVGFFIGQNVVITRISKSIEDMKPQMNPAGKGKWASFWGDKVKRNIKRVFSKSDRQKCKLDIQKDLQQGGGKKVDQEKSIPDGRRYTKAVEAG